MFEAIKKLFKRETIDYAQMMKNGAVIIDVRTPHEFDGGHIPKAKNIPLAQLPQKLGGIADKNKVYITCCASGMRSASARSILKRNGYTNVYNGGGWQSLKSKIN